MTGKRNGDILLWRLSVSPPMKASIDKNPLPVAPDREEGVYLNDLADGTVIEIETQHHHYTLVKRAGSQVQISGHPKLCPEPIAVQIEGSVATRPMVAPKPGFIGRGMYMIFKHPVFDNVTTSRIREIHSKSPRG